MTAKAIRLWWRCLWCPHASRQTRFAGMAILRAVVAGAVEPEALTPANLKSVTTCLDCGKELL